MKTLYLMRHADAFPKGAGEKDSQRRLTPLGKRQAQDVARIAKAKNVSFDLILTSPYARAKETAEIVADVYHMGDRLSPDPSLACGCGLHDIQEILKTYQKFDSILCVGHEPDFGEISAALLCLDHARPLKKAEIVEILISAVR